MLVLHICHEDLGVCQAITSWFSLVAQSLAMPTLVFLGFILSSDESEGTEGSSAGSR